MLLMQVFMLEAAIVIGGVVNGPIIGIFTAGSPQLSLVSDLSIAMLFLIFDIFTLVNGHQDQHLHSKATFIATNTSQYFAD